MSHNPFRTLIGIRILSARDGQVVARLAANPQLYNARGVIHGAAICALSESALGTAVRSAIGSGDKSAALEVKLNYLEPGRGELEARARLLRVGHTTAVGEAEVYGDDADGGNRVLAAKAVATFHIQRGANPPRPGATTALDPDYDGPGAR